MRIKMKSAGLMVVAMWCAGCKVENAPARAQLKEQKVERRQDAAGTPKEVPLPQVDQAQMVIDACGQPESDKVSVVHDHLDNGAVREMRYRKSTEVTLKFVPMGPPGKVVQEGDPLPPTAIKPVGQIVWKFSEAHMKEETLLASHGLRVYLPCFASAFSIED